MQEIEQENESECVDRWSWWTSLVYTWAWSRLDKRLSTQLPYSRSFFEHIIKNWSLTVTKRSGQTMLPKKSYMLAEWDQITIDSLERFTDGWVLQEAKRVDIQILHERDDYLVIHKPKWVLSHPNSVWDLETPSVVAWAYHHYKELPSMWNFIRAGLIHRLDRETDGVMLLAKTEKWLAYFKELFQQKSLCETIQEKESVPLKKFYRADCEITPRWETFLQEIWNSFPHVIVEDVIPKVPHPIVKEWITKIMRVSDSEWSWRVVVDIEILTWRTHQIRYHLSRYWLPIVWDYIYNARVKKNEKTGKGNPREQMQLTAYRLSFTDVEWKEIVVTCR